MNPPPGGGSRRSKWAILLISVAMFSFVSTSVVSGSGEEAAHSEEEAYTQRDYHAELKQHVVSRLSKHLPNGQILHDYRLAIADDWNNEEFSLNDGKGGSKSRHRRDTATTTKVWSGGYSRCLSLVRRLMRRGRPSRLFKKELYNYYTTGKAAVYCGVPYAQRPTHDLTFARPLPVNYTINPRLLNTNSNNAEVCPQNINGVVVGSKDCLYLNIITPELDESSPGYATSYPVMVFFHSGSLKEGGAYVFGPLGIVQNLVRRGMVVVTLQYRIGVYGFMNLNNSIAGITSNSARGMYDQVEVLKWIQRNIGAFKGDLKRVTLVGAGSGACCAALLYYASVTKEGEKLLNPTGKNPLFSRLILQSGSSDTCRVGGFRSDFHNGFKRTSSSEFLKATDCRNHANTTLVLRRLQAQTVNYVLANTDAQIPYPIWDLELPDGIFSYSADAAYAASKYTQSARKKIDVLIGMTRDEAASYDVSFERRFKLEHYTYRERMKIMLKYVTSNYSDSDADAFIARIVELYRPGVKEPPDNNSTVSFWYDLYVEAFTDYMTTSSILLDARRFATLGNKVYLYKIFVGTNGFFQNSRFLNSTHNIVPHAIELPYIFMPERLWNDGKLTTETYTAEMFGQLWYNFVSSGKVKGIGGHNNTGMEVAKFDGTINLATGEIGSANTTKSGYNMVFDYLFIGNYTSYSMKSNVQDAVFIRNGAEQFWTEWKYEQLTHYKPAQKTYKRAKLRSGKKIEPRDLMKKHREERLRSLIEP